ncbi:MAG: response regulator transcription factor [Longimicrobiales bacterium]
MDTMGVVIISPVRLFRDGLHQLLRECTQINVLAALKHLGEPCALPDAARANGVIVDARSIGSNCDGQFIRSRFPCARVFALGVTGTATEASRCRRYGVDGVIGFDCGPDEIVSVLDHFLHAESRELREELKATFQYVGRNKSTRIRLGKREYEVALLTAEGCSNKQIAQRLGIEVSTVKNHVHSILNKVGASRRSELAARVQGWLTQDLDLTLLSAGSKDELNVAHAVPILKHA